jgi:hypothetical protein
MQSSLLNQEDPIQELRWYTCVTQEQRWLRGAVRASIRLVNPDDDI